MAKVNKLFEMRGMKREELVNYFISIGGSYVGNMKYIGIDWEVEIGEQEICRLGVIEIPAAKILLSVEEENFDSMVEAFRLRFLSAGG